jgi:hypothetical protein
MPPLLVPVVEGHAKVAAVPVLLRRLLAASGRPEVAVAQPVRVKRYQVVRPGELERAFELARRTRQGCGAILLLLDADDDCPKELAPALLQRAQAAGAGLPVAVVLAKSELEAWFVGSLESLHGVRGIDATATAPAGPEDIRDAKGYLSRHMAHGRRCVEVDDQPALARRFDPVLARQRCPSFDKFVRAVEGMLAAIGLDQD